MPPPQLLYDDTCAFCRTGVRRLQRLTGGRVSLLPSQSDEARALLGDDHPRTAGQLVLVADGAVYGGAEAVARALALSPWWRLVACVYWWPGVRWAADRAYRAVASRRHCVAGRCELPGG